MIEKNAPDALLISVSEAARLLSVGRDAAWALVWNGQLTSMRVGKRRLVPRQSLEAFIAQRIALEGLQSVTLVPDAHTRVAARQEAVS